MQPGNPASPGGVACCLAAAEELARYRERCRLLAEELKCMRAQFLATQRKLVAVLQQRDELQAQLRALRERCGL